MQRKTHHFTLYNAGMVTILHGENVAQSRAALTTLIHAARAKGSDIIRFSRQDITVGALRDALELQALFSSDRLVVLEECLPAGKKRSDSSILDLLAKHIASKEETPSVVVWEQRKLNATELKKLTGARTQLFKTSSAVFAWIDSIAPGNAQECIARFRAAVRADGVELCFAMLVRQVLLLLQASSGVELAVAPFIKAKLAKQLKRFGGGQLEYLLESLNALDRKQKRSELQLPLENEIELLLMSL